MTYDDKYDSYGYSIYRCYRDIRANAHVNVQIGRLYPNILDHVVLDDGDVDTHLICEVANSNLIDDAIASIQRFAARCLAADRFESMVNAMSQLLAKQDRRDRGIMYSRRIIYVFQRYGAKLDPNDPKMFNRACECGNNDVIEHLIRNGRVVTNADIICAIESGNCETIKLVFRQGFHLELNSWHYKIDLLNATIESMELIMSLNIIQRGTHYKLEQIPSFSVLQWILDHDVMKHDEMLIDIAYNAACDSGHYFDMLRYLIEQRNFTVPLNLFSKFYLYCLTDLDVLDYLLLHGADVNAVDEDAWNVLVCAPMFIRYWIDKGLIVKSDDALAMMCCIQRHMTVPVLEMMIDKYSMDINADNGHSDAAIHRACSDNRCEVVEMLLQRGADVNKRNYHNRLPYDLTSDNRIQQLLIDHGYRHVAE